MKIINKIIVGLFAGALLVMFVSHFAIPAKAFSDQENRSLAQMPVFSVKELFSGKYMSKYEEYIQDQFIARDKWILLKTTLEKISGKNENNAVYFGKDDWYFETKATYDEQQLTKNLTYINNLSTFLSENDITSTFLPIYSSYMYYPELMPENHQNYDESEIYNQLISNLDNVNILDGFDSLLEHKDEAIYFKTDHHWSQLGAYYAYTLLADVYEFTPIDYDDFTKKTSNNEFYGTLYSKAPLLISGDEFYTLETDLDFSVYIGDNDKTFDSMYFYENFDKKDQYVTYLDGNHGLVKITSENKNGKKLLMLKDSYSHALAPLLANHFEEIILVDMRYNKTPIKQFILDNEIDDVLYSYNVSWFANDKNLYWLQN